MDTAGQLKEICAAVGVPFIYKSSFDKANRSSGKSFRGVGMDEGLQILADVRTQIGVPVLTSSQSQIKALQLLGSRKIATVHPYEPEHNARHEAAIREFGFEPAGVIAVGGGFSDLGSIPEETALDLARRIKAENPEADTIHFASAHWATAGVLDQIERELGVSVMTSHQAIT